MIRQSILFYMLLSFTACSQTSPKTNAKTDTATEGHAKTDQDFFDRFDDAILQSERLTEKTLKKNKLPGVAVAVLIDDQLIWSKGFGYADVDSKTVIDPFKSQFRIGSVSKPFTATALGQLYEQGKLGFDDPIQKHVSYFPEKKYPITVRQVAGHLAGIRHYKGKEFISNKFYESVKESLTIFQDDPLLHQPGTKYAYSSYGWNLISAVVEGASGEEFLSYMDNHVFKPLGLENTGPDLAKEENSNRVSFYKVKDKTITLTRPVDNSYKWAGGGFLSSAVDVAKFGNAYLKNTLLKESTKQELWKPLVLADRSTTNYGMGWSNNKDKKGRQWNGHSGGSIGGTSMLLLYPDYKMVVVVLTNLSRAKLDKLPFRIADQFLMVE